MTPSPSQTVQQANVPQQETQKRSKVAAGFCGGGAGTVWAVAAVYERRWRFLEMHLMDRALIGPGFG